MGNTRIKPVESRKASALAEGMESGPNYKQNIQGALEYTRGLIGGKPENRNEFSDEMGGNGKNYVDGTPRSGETMGTNPDLDRAKAYEALQALQKRHAQEDSYQKLMEAKAAAMRQQAAPTDADFDSSMAQFDQMRAQEAAQAQNPYPKIQEMMRRKGK